MMARCADAEAIKRASPNVTRQAEEAQVVATGRYIGANGRTVDRPEDAGARRNSMAIVQVKNGQIDYEREILRRTGDAFADPAGSGQRHQCRAVLRAGGHRLHAHLRRPERGEFRPRRDVHARRLRRV